MKCYCLANKKLQNKGHELDEMAKYICDADTKWIICYNKNEQLKSFVDGGKNIQTPFMNEIGKNLNIIEHSAINDIPEYTNGTSVIIETKDQDEYESIAKKLTQKGYKENESFFQLEVFLNIYSVYKKNKVRLDYVEFFITERCTLRCRDCCLFVPYYEKPINISKEKIINDIDLLMSKVDYIERLRILGGEPLLHPDLKEILEAAAKYKDKIGFLCIVTNATIMPKDDVIKVCQENNIAIVISDYSIAGIDKYDEKLKKFIEKIENKVEYFVKPSGNQWFDIGFPHTQATVNSKEELINRYNGCATHCRSFYDGKLYYCGLDAGAVRANLFPETPNDYFDFKKEFSKQELLEYDLGFCPLGYVTFCGVCGGSSPSVNNNYVPAAIQND